MKKMEYLSWYNYMPLRILRHKLWRNIAFLLLLGAKATAQNEAPFEYKEQPSDPYIQVPEDQRVWSAPYHVNRAGFVIRQVNVDENGKNIVGDAANEPSIAIDPAQPKRMAIGWRQFETITSNFRQAGYANSSDGGDSWQNQNKLVPFVFRTDPVLEASSNGDFFYNSLSIINNSIYKCYVHRSADGGALWDEGVYAYGGDKQWMAIDQTADTSNGNIYAIWTTTLSSCNGGFTRSLDRGESFEECSPLSPEFKWGTITIGKDKQVYACGEDAQKKIVVHLSQKPFSAPNTFTWDSYSTVNLGGVLVYGKSPNPEGILGQVWIDVDRSEGPFAGTVYVLASVRRTGNGDPSDIMLSKSTDGGKTWSSVVRINNDVSTTNNQWFGSLSVAPNGRLDVTWLDTRDNPGTYLSRLYYAFSTDGGKTWSPNIALSEAFDPAVGWPNQRKMGDYFHQRSDDKGAHLAWAATFNGEQDVYYSYINAEEVSQADTPLEKIAPRVTASPNPFTDKLYFLLTLPDFKNEAHIDVVNAQGQLVATLRAENLLPGSQPMEWNTNVPEGIYYYRCVSDGVIIGQGKVLKK